MMKRFLPFLLLLLLAVPLQGSELAPLVQEICRVLARDDSPDSERLPKLILIGGCPGVGKTALAKLLQDELAVRQIGSIILHQDHYSMNNEERRQFSNELDPRRMLWEEMHHTLRQVKEGVKIIHRPVINPITRERNGVEEISLEDVACIFFEGSYALGDFPPMDFLSYADLSIYLETSLENIYDWKWERDQKKQYPRTEELFFVHMMSILRDFAFHVYPTRRNAHLIVEIDRDHRFSLQTPSKPRSIPDFSTYREQMLQY